MARRNLKLNKREEAKKNNSVAEEALQKAKKVAKAKLSGDVITMRDIIDASADTRVQKVDADGNPVVDENGAPVYQVKVRVFDIVEQAFTLMNLQYQPDSKVGAWTSMAVKILSANNADLLKHIKKAFPHAGENSIAGYTYTSVFYRGLNHHSMLTEGATLGMPVDIKYVSNREIKEFDLRLRRLDLNSITVEDIARIKLDLWHLFRAWQESSIDMTKDKRKAFSIAMDIILGHIDVINDILDYDDNTYDVLSAIESGIKADKSPYDIEAKFVISPLTKADEKKADIVESSLGNLALHMLDIIDKFSKEEMVEALKHANLNRWEELAEGMKPEEGYIKLSVMINKVFKLLAAIKSEEDAKIMPGHYKLLRDAIYSYNEKVCHLDKEEVILVAIYTCFYRYKEITLRDGSVSFVSKAQYNTVGKISYVASIFGAILEAAYEDEEGGEVAFYDVEEKDFVKRAIDIKDGDFFEVFDGLGYVGRDDEDDPLPDQHVFELKDKEYSGEIYCMGNRIVKTVDVYATADINFDLDFFVASNHMRAYVNEEGKKVVEKELPAPGSHKDDVLLNTNALAKLERVEDGFPLALKRTKEGNIAVVKAGKSASGKLVVADVISKLDEDYNYLLADGEDTRVISGNLFKLGIDNSEPYKIGETEYAKPADVFMFNVDMNDYFSEADLKWLKAASVAQEERERKENEEKTK